MLLANSYGSSDKKPPNWYMNNLISASCFLCLEHYSLEYMVASALVLFWYIFKHHFITEIVFFFNWLHLKKKNPLFPTWHTLFIPLPYLIFLQNANRHVIYTNCVLSPPLEPKVHTKVLCCCGCEQYQKYRKCSINSCLINEWMILSQYLFSGLFTNKSWTCQDI